MSSATEEKTDSVATLSESFQNVSIANAESGDRDLEKFYTIPSTVAKCVSCLQDSYDITAKDFVIEPSAGSGVFCAPLRKVFDPSHSFFYDKRPESAEVQQMDWFNYDWRDIPRQSEGRVFVIGNPPYSMALDFIKKALEQADVIGFILPLSARKKTGKFRRSVPKNLHVVSEMTLPDDSFLLSGRPHHVPSAFVIWEKMDDQREDVQQEAPLFYSLVAKDEADFAIKKKSPQKMERITENWTRKRGTWYFIKMNDNKEDVKQSFAEVFDECPSSPFPDASFGVGAPFITSVALNSGLNSLQFAMETRIAEKRVAFAKSCAEKEKNALMNERVMEAMTVLKNVMKQCESAVIERHTRQVVETRMKELEKWLNPSSPPKNKERKGTPQKRWTRKLLNHLKQKMEEFPEGTSRRPSTIANNWGDEENPWGKTDTLRKAVGDKMRTMSKKSK